MVRFSLPPNLDYSSSQSLLLSYQERLVWKGKQRKRRAAIIAAVLLSQRTTIIGRNPNRHDVDYPQVVGRILRLKLNPRLFTRMFRLSPASFDRVLSIIDPVLRPVGVGVKNIVPPIIKLCLGLRILAGGSYLDLNFAYQITHNHIHHYAWEAIVAIDSSMDSFIDNISFPLDDPVKLDKLAAGFSRLGGGIMEGTVAAGDGIIFKMVMPTNEEVDYDVKSYWTRKGFYAFGLQAFCDSNCRFVSIASKLCSSSYDNTAYIHTDLSKSIKAGHLHPDFHVVLDEGYVCTQQEMTPWKGRHLSTANDAFNYFLSLQRQVIERAFGILIQRWGLLWRPLRISYSHRGLAVRVACKLHNICIDQGTLISPEYMCSGHGSQYGFAHEKDCGMNDHKRSRFTDGVTVTQGHRSDLERCDHRDKLTEKMEQLKQKRPDISKFSRSIVNRKH